VKLITVALAYARYRYVVYRIVLRLRMGKSRRDEFLKHKNLRVFDFLPEGPYNANGIKVLLRKGTHDYYMFFQGVGSVLWGREQFVRAQLVFNEKEVFVDVGANVGSHSLRVAHNYATRGVKVIAIEADSEAHKALVRNIKCNKLTNINAINIAVSDHEGTVALYERSYDGTNVGTGLHSIMNELVPGSFNFSNGKSIEVSCNTLDNILSNQKADVVKIDIEGAEVLALRGATNLLRNVRTIIVEIHGGNLERVKEILESFDFKLEISPRDQYVVGTGYRHSSP
jgi:FkbM family methyltransferase